MLLNMQNNMEKEEALLSDILDILEEQIRGKKKETKKGRRSNTRGNLMDPDY
jgi:hypothetical protein